MPKTEWSVHVVHPYTYKFDNGVNVVGPIERFRERDSKINQLLNGALETGVPLVHENYMHVDPKLRHHEIAMILLDVNLRPLLDERVVRIKTSQSGLPLPDEKTQSIPEEIWQELKRIYDTKSSVAAKLPQSRKVLFIGGVYENCLCNSIHYFNTELKRPEQEVYVCPELSVSLDDVERNRVRTILLSENVRELSANQALQQISKS